MRLIQMTLVTAIACAFSLSGTAETTIDTKGHPHRVETMMTSFSPVSAGSADTKGRRHAYAITASQISESDVSRDTKGRPRARQGFIVK